MSKRSKFLNSNKKRNTFNQVCGLVKTMKTEQRFVKTPLLLSQCISANPRKRHLPITKSAILQTYVNFKQSYGFPMRF